MSWFLLDRNLKLLEPYDWKLSRTVLRGERGSNAPDLPGIAIYRDYGLGMAYARYKQSMKPQEAIVKIARKMSNIIFSVLKNSRKYEPYRWDKE